MNASARDWSKLQNILILLLALTLCLYLPTLFHYAFADDEIYLAYTNRFLRQSDWTQLYQLFLGPTNPWEFLPLRDFTYWLDFRIYGDELTGFHFSNLVFYVACGFSVYWFFREVVLWARPEWKENARVLGLVGALVFMAHPTHVEVVAWIASRKDLLAALFSFIVMAMLASELRGQRSMWKILLSALVYFVACFGKASAMTMFMPISALIIADVQAQGLKVRRSRNYWALFLFTLLFIAAFVVHFNVGQSTGIRIQNAPGFLFMLERASRILSTLLGMLVFPYPLRFYHDVYQLGSWHWLVSILALGLTLISLRALFKHRSLWAMGVLLTLSSVVVYLQLMPFTTWSLASERFVFVSVAGLALVIVDALGRLPPKVISCIVMMFFIPSVLLVWDRVQDWQSSQGLLAREYELQPAFHNAIRDRIIFTLLPEKRYDEAAEIAERIPRLYAVNALRASIATERAFRILSDLGREAEQQERLKREFCTNLSTLRDVLHVAYRHIPSEPDISYNNLLRMLDRQIYFRFADAKFICASV